MDSRLTMLLAIVALLNCVIRSSNANVLAEPCPGCTERKRLTNEIYSAVELRQARMELIKMQILQKLRLSKPPKLSKSVVPSVLTHGDILRSSEETVAPERDVDDYYGTMQNVVILAENSTYDCFQPSTFPSTCLHFHSTGSVSSTGNIVSAHLWIYRTFRDPSNKTYVINEIQIAPNDTEYSERVQIHPLREKETSGWYKYDVTIATSNWSADTDYNKIFQIECEGCSSQPIATDSSNRPFIVINTDNSLTLGTRKKRNVDCTEGMTGCCRESLYVSFEELGWNDWIIAPPGYNANYCRGSCKDPKMMQYYHSTVLHKYGQTKRFSNEEDPFNFCCTPSQLSSLSILYRDANETITHELLPKLVVNKCACA